MLKKKEKSRLQAVKWNAANRERRREITRAGCRRKREKDRVAVRASGAASKRKLRADPEWRRRELVRMRSWRRRNKAKIKEYNKKAYEKNKEQYFANNHAYRARKRGAVGRYKKEDVRRLWSLQRGKCAFCLVSFVGERFTVDHYKPLSKGGSNEASNLRLLCRSCNSSKSNLDPVEFGLKNGTLAW